MAAAESALDEAQAPGAMVELAAESGAALADSSVELGAASDEGLALVSAPDVTPSLKPSSHCSSRA